MERSNRVDGRFDVQGDEVVFSKLCRWTKDTILAPSPKPCQIHPELVEMPKIEAQ